LLQNVILEVYSSGRLSALEKDQHATVKHSSGNMGNMQEIFVADGHYS
jgi:hypothetical protein